MKRMSRRNFLKVAGVGAAHAQPEQTGFARGAVFFVIPI